MLEHLRDGDKSGVIMTLPYAMILTQTCELQQPDKAAESPFINVVPVYDAWPYYEDASKYLLEERRLSPHLIRLNSQSELPQGPGIAWVANLRIDIMLDRAALLERMPLEGLENEEAYLSASRRIGSFRSRPAVADDVHKHILVPFEKRLKKKDLRDKVLEVRIELQPGPLAPKTGTIYLLCAEADINGVSDIVHTWFTDEFNDAYRETNTGIIVRVPKIMNYETFGRKDQARSIEIDFRTLSSDDHR